MSWRDRITKDTPPKTSWRDRIVKDIVVQGVDGKDFVFHEHKDKIENMIKNHIDNLKEDLKLKPSDLTKADILAISKILPKPKEQKPFDLQDHIESLNEWIDQHLEPLKKKAPLMMGGISEAFVNNYVAEQLANFVPSTTQNIATTTASMQVDVEDVIVCIASAPITINLVNIADASKPIKIKNSSSFDVTISADALIDGQTGWTINQYASFTFVPAGGVYHAT